MTSRQRLFSQGSLSGLKKVAKRLRWPDDLDPQLRKWLTRVQRVHAHLRTTLAIYTTAIEVGGCSLGNDNYQRRVKRQDRTILHDALTLAMDEYGEVLEQVQAVMDSATPTMAMPGTRDKVDVMEARAREGFSIFIESDAKH